MKKILLPLTLFVIASISAKAQQPYDSITISRITIENNWHGPKWPDTLRSGRFKSYLYEEKTMWRKPEKASKELPKIISLVNRVKNNGTEDVSKCFIPRHSINFYKGGKIIRYLLVCFECDGVRFSDEPAKPFIRNIGMRDKQMAELKELFKDIP